MILYYCSPLKGKPVLENLFSPIYTVLTSPVQFLARNFFTLNCYPFFGAKLFSDTRLLPCPIPFPILTIFFFYYPILSKEFRVSTRRSPTAARRRTVVHRVRAVGQEERSNHPKGLLKIDRAYRDTSRIGRRVDNVVIAQKNRQNIMESSNMQIL